MSAVETTLVVIKPDAVHRRLVGHVIQRFEQRGLQIRAMKMLHLSEADARELYSVHEGKEFYEPLVAFATSGPVVAMMLSGPHAIDVVRDMMGPTFGPEAPAGSIRGDFGLSRRFNIVHSSDSAESLACEMPVFFSESDVLDYAMPDDAWLAPPEERAP
ncbi:MAG: nucleoside-diphosphate kinase [Planctomycetes bacterium]|jgi:nucleoside-diphosphate kinase|nr:nucleoside-diphosphate kinase [Planctomycetota bacterium]